MNLHAHAWPHERSGEAIAAVARAVGFPMRDGRLPRTTAVEHAAAWLGLDAEPVEIAYEDVDDLVFGLGAAIVDLGTVGLLAIAKTSKRRCTLASPDGSLEHVPSSAVRAAFVATLEARHGPAVDEILRAASIPERRYGSARRALLRRALSGKRVRGVTLLRLRADASVSVLAKDARLGRSAGWIMAAHALRNVLLALGWWLIGRAALDGRTDRGLLAGWALVILTQVPLTVYVGWVQGMLAIEAGALLKRRMLSGELYALGRDEIRREGAGQLLGRVLEADAVESLALGAGFAAAPALVELVLAIVILFVFGSSVATGIALVGWTALAGVLSLRYARRRAAWTTARLDVTHDLVERMVGHRTRLAQQAPARWHDGEDELLARYVAESESLDRTAARLWAVLPRGWLVLALASLLPSLANGVRGGGAELAIGLGATLLAYRALRKLLAALSSAAGAAVAWEKARPLFGVSMRDVPATPEPVDVPSLGPVRLEATGISYRYDPRAGGEPALRDGSLSIEEGERVLLLGRSGAGKSTLAALLCGLRQTDTGLVTIGGLDRQTLGLAGFRRYVVAAPQFHDNFLLGSTLAFNLLMGRSWPPSEEDLAVAEEVCRELGLGPLLDRMPSGLQTQVGETGWQLSHGERSRVYLARALLQNPRVLMLDESFGALDPATLEKTMERVLRERAAVVVIAHP